MSETDPLGALRSHHETLLNSPAFEFARNLIEMAKQFAPVWAALPEPLPYVGPPPRPVPPAPPVLVVRIVRDDGQ
jgi:hypothetical protein